MQAVQPANEKSHGESRNGPLNIMLLTHVKRSLRHGVKLRVNIRSHERGSVRVIRKASVTTMEV